MKDAPAFDFYPERWLAGTMHLSPAERGAYINLLCHQWLHGSIPADAASLSRVCGCKPSPAVLAKFETGQNAMLEKVRTEQRARIARSLDKIAKMNAARSSCRASTRGSTREAQEPLVEDLQGALGQGSSCRPPHHSPLTPVLLEKEPKRSREEAATAEAIYEAYPRKVGKPKALATIRKALANPPHSVSTTDWPAQLLAIVKRYAALRKGEDPQFTPHPATWFHQRRFEDDPSTWKSESCQPNGKPHRNTHQPSGFAVFADTGKQTAGPAETGRLF